jgi:hypothetical protein
LVLVELLVLDYRQQVQAVTVVTLYLALLRLMVGVVVVMEELLPDKAVVQEAAVLVIKQAQISEQVIHLQLLHRKEVMEVMEELTPQL